MGTVLETYGKIRLEADERKYFVLYNEDGTTIRVWWDNRPTSHEIELAIAAAKEATGLLKK